MEKLGFAATFLNIALKKLKHRYERLTREKRMARAHSTES